MERVLPDDLRGAGCLVLGMTQAAAWPRNLLPRKSWRCPSFLIAKCQEAFGSRSIGLGQDPETAAYLIALKRLRLTYAQIFDRYRRDHADWFPWAADDPEYEQKREGAIDAIKKTVRRLKSKLKTAVDREDGPIPESR